MHIVHQLWRAQAGGDAAHLLPLIESTQPLVDEAWLRKMAEELAE